MNISCLEEAVLYQACPSTYAEHVCSESPELPWFILNARNAADCQETLDVATICGRTKLGLQELLCLTNRMHT